MTPAEQTAAYVALHTRIGSIAQRRRVPRARPPTLIEADYAHALVSIVIEWRAAVQPFIDALPALVTAAHRQRHDALLDRIHRIGLPIVIENPVGSVRRWTDSDGTEGTTVMRHAYGYIEGVRGADGEDVDVYLGPLDDPEWVFVVHQQKKSAGFAEYDEDKVMLGWPSADEAKAAYVAQYDDPRFFGGMTVMSRADFVTKLTATDDVGKIRHDDSAEGRQARALLSRARYIVTTAPRRVEAIAERAARSAAQHHRQEFSRQAKAALGVELPTLDRALPIMVDAFGAENAKLMESLGARTLDAIEKLSLAVFARGGSVEDLAKEIERRFAIAERHARFIARDQIGGIAARIARARHKEVGIRLFRWLSRNDGHVRPTHKSKHDRVFAYTGEHAPPFFPGDEAACRCEEEPVFDEIRSLANIPSRARSAGYRAV